MRAVRELCDFNEYAEKKRKINDYRQRNLKLNELLNYKYNIIHLSG